VFDAGIGPALRAQLEEGLTPLIVVLDTLGIERLWVSKHKVSSVHGCEVRFLAEDDAGFDGWTVPRARGTVAHRAIELSMHIRDDPVPGELVDHALAALTEAETNGLADWLQSMTELERADLRGAAIEQVCAFLESWPPLSPKWRPRSESKVRVELLGERITLQGKVDLTLGTAEGTRAGKVLIDLKTGGFVPAHRDDLRFYALIEAIKVGVPPRRVATHYLESGNLDAEAVSDAMLTSAALRVIDAVHRWLELRAGHVEPVVKPSPACRWCPVLERCDAGRQHLAAVDDW
jgi:CRISPR/Cas system-associated exonuclease Cas4 (RecB family)